MKKKLLNSIWAFLLLTGVAFSFNACTTYSDDYLSELEIRRLIEQAIKDNNQNLEITQWEIVNIQVKKNDWKWNDKAEQWEAFADLPELTEFIYENGAALGYIFLGTQGVDEVQKLLPYVNTYSDFDGSNTFTETISCDFQLGTPSTVGFFIKLSDLFEDLDAPQNYNFRIVLIW